MEVSTKFKMSYNIRNYVHVPTPTLNPLHVVIFSYFWMSLHAVLFCSSIGIQHKTLNLPGHLIFQLELVYDIRPPLGSRKTSVVVVSLRATSKKNNCLQNSHKLSISAKAWFNNTGSVEQTADKIRWKTFECQIYFLVIIHIPPICLLTPGKISHR